MSGNISTKFTYFFIGAAMAFICMFAASVIGENLFDSTNSELNTPTPELQRNLDDERNKPSPMNYFMEEQIKVYKDRVILDAENIEWASFEDTKSMLPVISSTSNALQIVPDCPEQIQVGDIVSYRSEYASGIIIHRVAFIGEDEKGTYFVLKGDNNPSSDPGKIRCSQIDRKVVAVIY